MSIQKDSTRTMGMARFVGNFENGSPEWHHLRSTGIGGSDVAAICGLSPWTSPFALWARKTGRIDDTMTEPSEPMEWGNRLEPVILDKFAENHPEFHLFRNVGTWAHRDRPWQLANPDAIFEWDDPIRRGDDTFNHVQRGIVEVKTAAYEDDWRDGVPRYYRTQVQWYLQTFGYERAFVVVLFAGRRYREFEIWADDWEQDLNLSTVEEFRANYILDDRQPDFDGALSTYETVREMHPEIEDGEVELGDLGIHYEAAQVEFEKAERHLNEMKSRVLDAMGNSKRGLILDVWKVTRQARNGGKPYLVSKKG